MTDKFYFCPECGASVKLEMGRKHMQWHQNLETILESIIIKSDAPVLRLIRGTREDKEN